MITITKERLLTIKQWRETYGPDSNVVLPAEEAEELARIALVSLEAEPVAKIIAHYPLGVDVGKQKFVQAIGELPDFGGYLFAAPPAPIVPEEMYWQDAPVEGSSKAAAYATGWNDCREAMLQSGNFRENKDSSTNNFRKIPEASTSSPVTPALLPGGFTIEDAKELHEDLARSHISKALSGEKMKKKDRDADLRWIHGVIVQAAWFVKASLEQNALSGNYPVTPDSWISCSERMPDKLIPVMVMYEDGEMWSAMWNGNRWDDGTEYPDPHSVTHWREMPAAPQQEVNQ
ncbi:DUF551 domain-containing protein [Escherichia coli]|uniref:PF04448 family protein n=8 Tax=Escherichia coli TaxID=562 RepID=A0AAN4ADB1_ECOLX|nr:DUF551 domain-containing protein [Escherichia coli]EFN8419924.1 DUF551 domain-containing protein [Escherichia coli O145]EHW78188.1 hypothetical protein ECDEC10D_2971 [Escherichia coli DEC10D]EFF2427813.1 DUF551 domain-containing protein [Escherichia coli]EFJ1879711.1 DUF551 domain-containing protein [Escherichia coli]EFL4782448.1 DUF551 domain-containing protein [Escherichia coli]